MATKGFSIKGTAKTTGAIRPMAALAAETEKLRAQVEKLSAAQMKAGDSVDRFGERAKDIRGKFGQLAVATAGAVYAFDQVIERSMRLQNVQQNLPFAIDKARSSTQGLINDFELSRLAIEANRLGVAKSAEEFATMSEAAVKLGLSVGKDALSSVQDLTEGLGKGSPEVLNNLGIIIRAEDAYKQYAKQIGKLPEALTDAEKTQAKMTVGLEQAQKKAGEVTLNVDETTRSWIELKTELKNFADAVVPVIVGAFRAISDEIKLAQSDLFNLMETVTGGTTTLLDSLTTTRTRGVAGIGARPGEAGASAIAAGNAQRQAEDMLARQAEANIKAGLDAQLRNAQLVDFYMRREDAERRKKKRPRRGGGGAAPSEAGGGEANDAINQLEDKIVGAILGATERAGTMLGARAEGIGRNLQSSRQESAEMRRFRSESQLGSDMRAVDMAAAGGADRLSVIEMEEAAQVQFLEREIERSNDRIEQLQLQDRIEEEKHRARLERMQIEQEEQQKHAEMMLSLGTSVTDTLTAAGGAALRAGIMGGQGAREAVHGFATSKAIEMAILAATETARGLAAAASPITAPLAAGHFAAAGKAAAAGALAGALAGVTANGRSAGVATGRGTGGFFGSAFGGGSERRTSTREAPTQGGPIISRRGSSALVQSQSAADAPKGQGMTVNVMPGAFRALGFASQEEVVGGLRKMILNHEQNYGSVS